MTFQMRIDLLEAGIDCTVNARINAHEHHEWPIYPIPKHEGVDKKAHHEIDVLLQEGTRPDGFSPEERENLERFALECHSQAPEACQDGA